MKRKINKITLLLLLIILTVGLVYISRMDCLYGTVSINNKTPDSAIIEFNGIDVSGDSSNKTKQYSFGGKQFYFESIDGKTLNSIKTSFRVHTEMESPDFVEIYFGGLALDNTPEKNNFQITSYVDNDGLWLEIQVTSKWRGDKAERITKKYLLKAGTVLAIKINE